MGESLNSILEKLNLCKSFSTLESENSNAIVVLTISTNSPTFATIAEGNSEDEAKEKASRDAVHKMIAWMK